MSGDSVFKLIQPGCFDNQLTEILRQGVRALLAYFGLVAVRQRASA